MSGVIVYKQPVTTSKCRRSSISYMFALLALSIVKLNLASACSPIAESAYFEVSESHLPEEFDVQSKDVFPADVDQDGDVDLFIAHEYHANLLLLNDGSGRFSFDPQRLPATDRDSEDVTSADFDGDGDLDVVFANEDDRRDELYLNDGRGNFVEPALAFPGNGKSNAVLASDINSDGRTDILLGNADGIAVWIASTSGRFHDDSSNRIDIQTFAIQDLEFGDVDGDGDADLVAASDGNNSIYLNDGNGHFVLRQGAIPIRQTSEQTREADFADIDSDGDLDLYFANVALGGPGDARDRLLINDGFGQFSVAKSGQMPIDDGSILTMDADFVDLDDDGDIDIISTGLVLSRGLAPAPLRIFLNDGAGNFYPDYDWSFGVTISILGTDIEAEDFNGDGKTDLYIANRAGPDRLFLRR